MTAGRPSRVHNGSMSPRLVALLAVTVSTLTLAACAPYSDANTWVLTRLTDEAGAYVPAANDLPVTLRFENGAIQGSVCNSYSAQVSGWGSSFEISWIASTEMACMEPETAMQVETRYLSDLGAVTTITRDGELLVLTGPDVVLEFAVE